MKVNPVKNNELISFMHKCRKPISNKGVDSKKQSLCLFPLRDVDPPIDIFTKIAKEN